MFLDYLDQINEKVDKLLYVKFKTARQVINTWSSSNLPMDSVTQMDRLDDIVSLSRQAFNSVEGSSDKLRALYFLIVATYHQVAIANRKRGDGNGGSVDWDWSAGKREAQTMFRQYITDEFTKLKSAAEEEGRFFKKKRKKILGCFIDLGATVYYLLPLSLNDDHPKFPELEQAAQKVCSGSRTMLPYTIAHIVSDPVVRATLTGHRQFVKCCAVFENGRKTLSGSDEKTLIVWNLSTGKQLATLKGHTKGVSCCAVFDNDRKALSGSWDNTLIVWDLSTGKQLFKLEGHTSGVICCAIFDNDKKALSGSWDTTLRVWDISTGKQLAKLEGHTKGVNCCAVFDNGRKALSMVFTE